MKKQGSLETLLLVTSQPYRTATIAGRARTVHGLTMRQINSLVASHPEFASAFNSRLKVQKERGNGTFYVDLIAAGMHWSRLRTYLTLVLRDLAWFELLFKRRIRFHGEAIEAFASEIMAVTAPDTDPFFPTIKTPKKKGEKQSANRVEMNSSGEILVNLNKQAEIYGDHLTPGQLEFRHRSDEDLARRNASFGWM